MKPILPPSLLALLHLASACAHHAAEDEDADATPSESSLVAPDERSVSQLLDDRRDLLASLPADPSNASCTAKWQPLTADGKLDIALAIGYIDQPFPAGIVTSDESERNTLTTHLTAPCVPGYNACGFRFLQDNPATHTTVLTRTVQGREGHPLEVRLTLTNGAYGFVDEDNRGKDRVAQAKQTALAKAVFDDGLAKADIVFYSGHARDGGGPDFGVPRLLPSSHVDYRWYKAHTPGLSDLVEKLKAPGHTVKLLGLFACASKVHFNKSVLGADPDLGLVQSYKVTESEVLQQSLIGALDASIGQKCNDSFQKSVNVTEDRKIDLVNFF